MDDGDLMFPIGNMPNGRRLTAPTSVKVRGFQIQRTAHSAHWVDDGIITHDGSWPTTDEFYASWPWDADIKAQMDLAVAMGANTLKFYIAVNGIELGLYDRATHETRLRQFLDYAATLKVGVFMCTYFLGSEGAPNPMNTPTVAAELVYAVGVIGEYPNVIGIDCANESGWYEFVAWCRPRFKAVAPLLPISISVIVPNPAGWVSYLPSLGPYVDFYAFHPYYPTGTPAVEDLADFQAHEFHKPWLIDEILQSATYYDALKPLIEQPDCFGSIAYSTFDCSLQGNFADEDTGEIVAPERLAAAQEWPAWPPQEPTV